MLKSLLLAAKKPFVENGSQASFILIFVASAFFIPSAVWGMFFYLVLLPVTLFSVCCKKKIVWTHPWVEATGALLLWAALTLLWGENPGGGRVFKFASASVLTGVYLIALIQGLQNVPLLSRKIGSILIASGGINSFLSLLYFFSPLSTTHRLFGWGVTRHEILGSMAVGACALFALDRLLREEKGKLLNGFAALACVLFIVFAQSRGVYISMTVGITVLASSVYSTSKRRILLSGLFFLLAGALIMESFEGSLHDFVGGLLERGDSHRAEIWAYSVSRITESPLVGHGPAAYLGLDPFPFPHNFYLSTLFYYGLTGLVLLAFVLGWPIWGLIRRWKKDNSAPLLMALLLNALVGGMTDLAQYAQQPSPIWIFLWLPVCLAMANEIPKQHEIEKDKKEVVQAAS